MGLGAATAMYQAALLIFLSSEFVCRKGDSMNDAAKYFNPLHLTQFTIGIFKQAGLPENDAVVSTPTEFLAFRCIWNACGAASSTRNRT
jgi:hypothetical protein